MMPELKSPTKFKVLRAVNERAKSFGGLESRDLATILGISISHASKLLSDYWREGLLIRSKMPMNQGGFRYLYKISDPGKRRLAWFKKNF